MPLVIADRVAETTNSPGTGAVTLLGAVSGYQAFSSAIGVSNTTYYTIADQSGTNWEVGLGTLTNATTLTRTTVLASSNAGSAVNFSTGLQNVWVDYPSSQAVLQNSSPTFSSVSVANANGTGQLLVNAGGPTVISSSATDPDNAGVLITVNGSTDLTIDKDILPKGGTVGQTAGFIRIPSAAGNAGTPAISAPNTSPLHFNSATNTLSIYNASTSTWIPFVSGALTYAGVWNASTNTPTLASGVGTKGNFYVVSVAGATNLDGITDWQVGDWAVFNGTVWQQVNNTDAVVSVNGQTGAVVITLAVLGAGTIATQDAASVSVGDLAYTGTLTGGTGVANIGSGQIYKDANGNLGIGTTTPAVASAGRAVVIDATTGTAIEFRQSGTRVLDLIASSTSSALVATGTTLSLGAGGSTKFQMDSGGAWLAGNNAGTAGQSFTSGGAGQPAVWSDVQNGFIGGFTFNVVTVGGQVLETLNAITGVTTTLVISDEGTGDGAAIAAYFTANGSSAVYRFVGDTVTFSVASATASANSATVTLVGSVNFVNTIAGLTNLQIQVPAETRFLDVAIAPSLTGSVALDSFLNKQVLTLGLNPPTATVIGGVKAGANITIASDGTISATGGGGGGAFSSQVQWSTGSSSKNAYIDQSAGTINNLGIVIQLTASSGSGNLTNITVRLNGVALTNTYVSTGTFPNYTITVPVGDITDVAAQTAASVSVACSGTYSGGNFNVANAGTLTNVQPIAFTATLNGVYSPATLPFYTATSAINYTYTLFGTFTARDGVITPTGGTAQNATASSGTFASQPIAGATISGSATGIGQFGAGSNTVTLSGSIPAVSVYTPAFYAQTANSTPPTITTSSTQTAGAAQGSTVTYPTATVSTQYNWICTQRPLANIAVITPFGNAPLVPDVTAPTQTISGQTFNVYGVTGLDTLNPVQLVIS